MIQYLQGDCRDVLKTLPDGSVHCCVTSPPYWGLRDYGVDGQIGLEKTVDEFLQSMVLVFREVKRVLRDDGTLWLNLGDSYANPSVPGLGGAVGRHRRADGKQKAMTIPAGLKPKDLVGVPWRVAFALQSDGWYLRSDIIWAKPNPMPESVTDRPTKAHEYIFLLTKSPKYFYDADAIKEKATYGEPNAPDKIKSPYGQGYTRRGNLKDKQRGHSRRHAGFNERWDNMTKEEQCSGMRNKRTIWTVATKAYPEAHFATFPPDLITPCILAGCPGGGTVLDPFGGSGTTAQVAEQHGRNAIMIELNAEYIELQKKRTQQASLFAG